MESSEEPTNGLLPSRRGRPLRPDSAVLAIVPHFRCERWLADCLDALVGQTRPLQGIVVVDDGSPVPPLEIVKRFPEVTLLWSRENVGPYRVTQQVISETGYDAYLFQDADDWSGENRLAVLLDEAEYSAAEYVGSQGIRLLCDEYEAVPYTFPLDVNAALASQPTSNPLHHPTSIVSRDLVMRIGGFATGLRYGADTEFLRRAAFVARIVNSPKFCYFYRTRRGSLTGDPDTGLLSPARLQLRAMQHERALRNAALAASGKAPDLAPMDLAPTISLKHLTGPPLLPAPTEAEAVGTPGRFARKRGRSMP